MPTTPMRAVPKGMQLPRKNSEPNGILNFDTQIQKSFKYLLAKT